MPSMTRAKKPPPKGRMRFDAPRGNPRRMPVTPTGSLPFDAPGRRPMPKPMPIGGRPRPLPTPAPRGKNPGGSSGPKSPSTRKGQLPIQPSVMPRPEPTGLLSPPRNPRPTSGPLIGVPSPQKPRYGA